MVTLIEASFHDNLIIDGNFIESLLLSNANGNLSCKSLMERKNCLITFLLLLAMKSFIMGIPDLTRFEIAAE